MKRIRSATVALAAIVPMLFASMASGQELSPDLTSVTPDAPDVTSVESLPDLNDQDTADFSIVNGESTADQAVPGYVQIGFQVGSMDYPLHNCGGSLINKQWVLTAAHCVWNPRVMQDERRVQVLPAAIFRVNHPASGEKRAVSNVFMHPKHQIMPGGQLNWGADIALLKLDRPLASEARMALAAPNQVLLRKGHGVVWGRGAESLEAANREDNRVYDTIPTRKATVPINEAAFCGRNPHSQKMLCAEAPSPKGTSPASCRGDSGGPLTIYSDSPDTMIQIGIVSNAEIFDGMPFCGGQPTWYTTVSDYGDWIKSLARDVTFKGYNVAGPSGPPAALAAPAPAPAPVPNPTPPTALRCGDVNDPGSTPPALLSSDLRWQPTRGEAAGSDVSIVASRLTWTGSKRAKFAILAGECAWADALAATSLVAHGPLLLTNPKSLEPAVVNELQRLGVQQVVIVGGPAAVTPQVESSLTQSGYKVTRLQGGSRIETSVKVANYAADLGYSNGFTIVRGYPAPGGSPSQAFADSMGGAYFAPWMGSPIMLSASDSLSPEVATTIRQRKPEFITMFGGTAALSDQIYNQVVQINPAVKVARIRGASRADTAYQLGMRMLRLTGSATPKGVMVVEGQADDAWKVGFSFATMATTNQVVYALASGDDIAPESRMLIQQAKYLKLPIRCVASEKACALVNSI